MLDLQHWPLGLLGFPGLTLVLLDLQLYALLPLICLGFSTLTLVMLSLSFWCVGLLGFPDLMLVLLGLLFLFVLGGF